jgi:hypothetical protein
MDAPAGDDTSVLVQPDRSVLPRAKVAREAATMKLVD